jgi:hypothetical protein
MMAVDAEQSPAEARIVGKNAGRAAVRAQDAGGDADFDAIDAPCALQGEEALGLFRPG